ncbi:macro domain-containing protein [Streptobacillus felis]|uniref:macro domain-containing protein n=1 Tax=Streptobacillus felis TaxID=1384509 RepID=UPI00082F75AB|nr:macro domain-containing protein [Streptobacillus felis]
MSLKLVRNDITSMNVDAIVNPANRAPIYSAGIDGAVYQKAGIEKLLEERKKIGYLEEGDVAITPSFDLPSKYIIHAVSPKYEVGKLNFETTLRSCYKKSLTLAKEKNIKSIAFPIIATGSNGYSIKDGMQIALDEISNFLFDNQMDVYLVVFDDESTKLSKNIYSKIDEYIDNEYVSSKISEEYFNDVYSRRNMIQIYDGSKFSELDERIENISSSFQEYLFYLIKKNNLTNAEVYKNALIKKQTFSKIKLNKNYHPDKFTVLCLCIGAKLNKEESEILLEKAGYAFSSCDKRDVIFSFFIENKIHDMIEIDIMLEEYGLPYII